MRITAYVSLFLVGCKKQWKIDVPDEELEGLSDAEKEQVYEEYVKDSLNNYMEWGWYPSED